MKITKADEVEPCEIEAEQVEKLVELVASSPIKKEDIERFDLLEEQAQDNEELSNIIDGAIKETEKETKEDFKLSKEDVHEIKSFLVHLKDINIETKNNSYKSMIEILKETHYIKKSQSSNNKTTYALMFASGVAFGMADSKWMPFAKVIYDFFSAIVR